MKLLLTSVCLVVLLRSDESIGNVYDPEISIEARTNHLKSKCQLLKDPRRVEYKALFESPIESRRLQTNKRTRTSVCAPPKVASQAWGNVIRGLAADVDHESEERKDTRLLVVRHPLERLLSAYLFIFMDSSIHIDLTKKIKEFWLKTRSANGMDPLSPDSDESHLDNSGRDSLTFRQFVHFLTDCPKEYHECSLLTTDSVAKHWMPFWRWCQPCHLAQNYDFVLDLGHIKEDTDYVFKQLGLNATQPFRLKNPTKWASSSRKETKQKYFGHLTKREIQDLYLTYKLDHDLFGFSPQEYVDLAKDQKLLGL